MSGGADALKQALSEELTKLAKEEEKLDREREATIGQLASVRRRRDLIKALLASDDLGSAEPAATIDNVPRSTGFNGGDTSAANGRSVADMAYEILSKRGKEPLHYRELADLVRGEGGDLDGPNPAQTLVARIAKDGRFVRPAKRGWYSLREFYPRAKSVGSRKKKPEPGRKRAGSSK